jgi:hypothetical protein
LKKKKEKEGDSAKNQKIKHQITLMIRLIDLGCHTCCLNMGT